MGRSLSQGIHGKNPLAAHQRPERIGALHNGGVSRKVLEMELEAEGGRVEYCEAGGGEELTG